jgi:hypothetical protein
MHWFAPHRWQNPRGLIHGGRELRCFGWPDLNAQIICEFKELRLAIHSPVEESSSDVQDVENLLAFLELWYNFPHLEIRRMTSYVHVLSKIEGLIDACTTDVAPED